MTSPPYEAAARAWLERLPAVDRLAAQARTDLRLLVWIGAGALLIAACVAITRVDLVGRLGRAIEAKGPRPWLTRAAAALVVTSALFAMKSAYDVFVAWPAGGVGGDLAARATTAAAGLWPALSLAVLVVVPLQWLFQARPRSGSVIAGLGAIALSLAVGWGPYAFSAGWATPAPAGPVRDGLVQLIASSGVPARDVHLSPDPVFDADVTGGFGQAQVVIGQQVLGWPPAEARAYVGHLMGHYEHADVFMVFLLYGLVALGALVAVQRSAAPLARWLGAREAASAADAEALPAVALIMVLALGFATSATNGYLRWANVRADAFSLDHARAPDDLAAVLERTWDHESVDPDPIEEALFYSHPPLAKRLAHAMRWKFANAN